MSKIEAEANLKSKMGLVKWTDVKRDLKVHLRK